LFIIASVVCISFYIVQHTQKKKKQKELIGSEDEVSPSKENRRRHTLLTMRRHLVWPFASIAVICWSLAVFVGIPLINHWSEGKFTRFNTSS
jgi:hypothetical protein